MDVNENISTENLFLSAKNSVLLLMLIKYVMIM